MCSYLTSIADVSGTALAAGSWFSLRQAVVSFDHPQEAPVEHALCIDLRGQLAQSDPSAHVTVELDARSARHLAETILAVLGQDSAIRG